MRLEHVSNLLVQVLGGLTEVEVVECVTTRDFRLSIGSIFWSVVIQDGGQHRPLVGFGKPQGSILASNDLVFAKIA